MEQQLYIPDNNEQLKLHGVDNLFLEERIDEARKVIREVAGRSEKPLVIQFSGGRDSQVLLDLVKKETHWFVCAFMATGTELPGVVSYVRQFCRDNNLKLMVSTPAMHKGNLIKRIGEFKRFPLIESTWCCRDLKIRPENKMLVKTFGKGAFYRLEGIRRFESSRRKYIYAPYADVPIRPDGEFNGSFEVFPIINWNDDDVDNYIELNHLPYMTQYKDFGVSGCSWCPFYGPEIYYRVLKWNPKWTVYKRIIQREVQLDMPSVLGEVFLRDIREAVIHNKPCPETTKPPPKPPCTMIYKGTRVPTCQVYGHYLINGRCFRCEKTQEEIDGEQYESKL